MSNILQDIMGMLSRKKQVLPKTDDFITIARYASVQERMQPNPKVETDLITIKSLKKLIVPAAVVGASGTFTTADTKTVTVVNGIITNIVE
jgi:hypothetical protein